MRLLLAANADVRAKGRCYYYYTPKVVWTIVEGRCLLLVIFADVQGKSALSKAAFYGQLPIVKQLLSIAGLDVRDCCVAALGYVLVQHSVRDYDGALPIHRAAARGHVAVSSVRISVHWCYSAVFDRLWMHCWRRPAP